VVDGSYHIGGSQVGIRCTSKRFGDLLDRALSPYWATEPAHAVYSLVVADGTGDGGRPGKQFHVLYKYASPMLKTLHLPTLVTGLLSELESLTFGNRDDALYLHGQLVASNGTLAFGPGSMSSYLSRVGRRVERAGITLAPSRFTAIDPDTGQVVPVRSELDIPSDVLAELGALVPADQPDKRLGLNLDEPTRVDAVLDFSGDEALVPLSKALVVTRLTGRAINFPKLGMAALEGLGRLVQDTRCLGMGRPDPRGMLDLIVAALAKTK